MFEIKVKQYYKLPNASELKNPSFPRFSLGGLASSDQTRDALQVWRGAGFFREGLLYADTTLPFEYPSGIVLV